MAPPGVGIAASRLAATILIHPTYQNMLFAYLWQDIGGVGLWARPTARYFQPDRQPHPGDAVQRSRRAGPGDSAADNGSLWAGGASGQLLSSTNPLEMGGAAVQWQQKANFGSGYFAQPLAWGAGPSLYITLHRLSPAGGAFLRSNDGGATWTQLSLPG